MFKFPNPAAISRSWLHITLLNILNILAAIPNNDGSHPNYLLQCSLQMHFRSILEVTIFQLVI
jgi:hypothetical protein